MAFNPLAAQKDIKLEDKDTLGGSFVWNTGIYDVVVEGAYLDTSKGGAYSVNLILKDVNTDKKLTITEYITSGTEKGCLNYFINKKGEKQYLPGYAKIATLAQVLTGKGLDEQELEEKLVEVYDPEVSKRVPRPRQVIMSFIGLKFKAGIVKGVKPKYNDPDTIQEFNELDKVFNEDGKTITEIEADTSAKFIEQWKAKKGEDFVKDLTNGKAKKAEDKPKKSLFN